MKRLSTYINKLVNLTIKSKLGFTCNISGHVSAIGKEYILLIDSDKVEHSFKRTHIEDIKLIKKKQ